MELEVGGNFGSTYQQQPSSDWECLSRFLECLQNSQEVRVYLGVSEREEGKIPEEYKELIMGWTERGYKKVEEPKEKSKKATENSSESSDPWTKAGFSYKQKKEWKDIGLREEDSEFAYWLAKTKRLTPEEVLNYEDLEGLRGEYENTHADWS